MPVDLFAAESGGSDKPVAESTASTLSSGILEPTGKY